MVATVWRVAVEHRFTPRAYREPVWLVLFSDMAAIALAVAVLID